jgi:type VI secretion system protein ImpL
MVDGDAGSAPIDRIIGQIGQIQQSLGSVGMSFGEVSPLEALTRAGQGQLMRSLQEQAGTMPRAVGAIVTQITGSTAAVTARAAGSELENRYQQDVVALCRQFVDGRYPFSTASMSDVTLADFGRLFGPDGVFDRFFKTNLQNLVDTTRSPWAWRSGGSGASVGVSSAVLRQFEMAQRIRDRFFTPGSPAPQVSFTITPLNMDTAVSRFVLEVDGQRFEYQHGPERTYPARWPGPMPGAAAATFEDRVSGRPNIAFNGQWAWFRLLDAAQIRQESDLRHEITFEKGGYKAIIRLDAASVFNPFGQRELQQFRCEA